MSYIIHHRMVLLKSSIIWTVFLFWWTLVIMPSNSFLVVSTPIHRHRRRTLHSYLAANRNDRNHDESNHNHNHNHNQPDRDVDNKKKTKSVDDFLDTPFFDPNQVDEDDDTSPMGWFAKLVKTDYELAETLYVGIILFILLVLSQEILRVYMYGDNYVPFMRGGASGKLF